MKVSSLNTPLQFWLDCLENCENTWDFAQAGRWDDTVVKKDLYKGYLEWCSHMRKNHPHGQVQFFTELKKAVDYKTYRPRDGGIMGPRMATFPNLDECRKQFQTNIAKVDFDDE